MKFYPILILALLTFLLLFYFMFYLMASEMNQNTRLLRENELLQLQSAQYRNLQRSIDETAASHGALGIRGEQRS